jgi:membrane protease YdiL (CAAX protease family)
MISPLVAAERLLDPQGGAPPFLAVSTLPLDRIAYGLSALLLIPAAAAEELLFRGWLLRQAGAFLRRPLPLVAVSALTFSALHFDFAPDAFLTRAVMGAGFAYMTLRLGGIEFSAGAHAVNNLMIVLFLQPLDINPGGRADLSNFSIVEDLVLIGGYVLITELVARSTVLRRLAGVRERELSPAPRISTRFG